MLPVKDCYSGIREKRRFLKAVLPQNMQDSLFYCIRSCLTMGEDKACVITNTYSPAAGKSKETIFSLDCFTSTTSPRIWYKQSVAFGNTSFTYILPAVLSTFTVMFLCSSIFSVNSLSPPERQFIHIKKRGNCCYYRTWGSGLPLFK